MRIKPGPAVAGLIEFLRDGVVVFVFIFRFRIGFEAMTACPFQRDSRGRAARNRKFFAWLAFFLRL